MSMHSPVAARQPAALRRVFDPLNDYRQSTKELYRHMRADLRIRNYAATTQKNYLNHVMQFERHFGRCASELGPDEFRDYLSHRIEVSKWSHSWHRQAVSALRFLYRVTLRRPWIDPYLPYPKEVRTLPTVLSQEEVECLIQATLHPRTRLLLMTLYSAGLRLSEALTLARSDVDTARMVMHIRNAKGGKDRLVPLSPTLLEALRRDWRRHGDRRWIFPGQPGNRPITQRAVQRSITLAGIHAGLIKHVTSRTLRHSFATHLLEQGTDLLSIQSVLGHAHLVTTLRYLHLDRRRIASIRSPLDGLALPFVCEQLTLDGL